jgi:hypothetical protein
MLQVNHGFLKAVAVGHEKQTSKAVQVSFGCCSFYFKLAHGVQYNRINDQVTRCYNTAWQ